MISESIVFRRFHPDDLPEIIRIQNANQIPNLSRAEKADGFLSAEFSSEQFVQMDREIPMIVAVVADCGSRLGGYMCGCSLASGANVVHEMLNGDHGAMLDVLSTISRQLDDLVKIDESLEPHLKSCESVQYQLEDIAVAMRDYAQRVEFDP